MPSGLQIWDANGALIFDETTPVVKFLGQLTIGSFGPQRDYTGAAQSGSITDPRFTMYAQHVPFWCRSDLAFNNEGFDAAWTLSGNTLTWTYPRPDPYPVTIDGVSYYMHRPVQTIIYGIR